MATHGKFAEFKNHIKTQNIDVNRLHGLMQYAILAHDIRLFRFLIERGFDVNRKKDGATPLEFLRDSMFTYLLDWDYMSDAERDNADPVHVIVKTMETTLIPRTAAGKIQNKFRTNVARTKARAKLNTKVQQHTRRHFGGDVSTVIASFLYGEPKRKYTFNTFKKNTFKKEPANFRKFDAKLRESAKKNGVKLTTRVSGKRKYKSDSTLRVQIKNARKRNSN